MEFPQITISLLLKEKSTRFMFATYLGICCQGQIQHLIFIKRENDDWNARTWFLEGYLIKNATEKYNHMIAEK